MDFASTKRRSAFERRICVCYLSCQENGDELDDQLEAASPDLAEVKVTCWLSCQGLGKCAVTSQPATFFFLGAKLICFLAFSPNPSPNSLTLSLSYKKEQLCWLSLINGTQKTLAIVSFGMVLLSLPTFF